MARCRRASTTVAKQNGHWIAVPAPVGSPTLPPCARIDYFKQFVGLDLTKMYPAGAPPDKELADKWTWDTFLDGGREVRTRADTPSACRSA